MTSLKQLIGAAGKLIDYSLGLLIAVALLVFLWGLMKFILRIGGAEGKVEEGKNLMKWGLISLFVMVSVWGIVGFFQRALGIELNTTQNAPKAGVLPSSNYNYLLFPGNAPQPGVLPSKGNNPYINNYDYKGPSL